MSTVAELKTQIEEKIGTQTDKDILALFNYCLQVKLAPVLRLETTAQTAVTNELKSFSLPSDLYGLRYAKLGRVGYLSLAPRDEYGVNGYKLFDNEIILSGSVSTPDLLTVGYFRIPATLTAITETPDMPAQFHIALLYFYISKKAKDTENLEVEATYLQEFELIKDDIDKYTKKRSGNFSENRVYVQPFA